jgi:hypothetical protein
MASGARSMMGSSVSSAVFSRYLDPAEVLVGRDIRLDIVADGEDGARITATCPAARVAADDGDPAPQS